MSHDIRELSRIFGKYVGKEIPLVEKAMQRTRYRFGQEETFRFRIPEDNKTIKEIADLAAQHGLVMKVRFPDEIGTFGGVPNRLNVCIDKGNDNKYRIQQLNLG